MSESTFKERTVKRAAIVEGLRRVGLNENDVVLVHSAMRTIGPIVNEPVRLWSLLEVVGTGGTVVAPVFTFRHEVDSEPIIDPANDHSEMGAISEAIRLHPEALRSLAFRHSFAAIGRHARVIPK